MRATLVGPLVLWDSASVHVGGSGGLTVACYRYVLVATAAGFMMKSWRVGVVVSECRLLRGLAILLQRCACPIFSCYVVLRLYYRVSGNRGHVKSTFKVISKYPPPPPLSPHTAA